MNMNKEHTDKEYITYNFTKQCAERKRARLHIPQHPFLSNRFVLHNIIEVNT